MSAKQREDRQYRMAVMRLRAELQDRECAVEADLAATNPRLPLATRVSMARRAALAKEVELEWAKEMEREGEKEMEQGSWKAAVTPRAAVDSAGSSAGQESAVSMRAAVDSASSSAGQDSSLAVASRDASTDKSGVAGSIKFWVDPQRWLRDCQ